MQDICIADTIVSAVLKMSIGQEKMRQNRKTVLPEAFAYFPAFSFLAFLYGICKNKIIKSGEGGCASV